MLLVPDRRLDFVPGMERLHAYAREIVRKGRDHRRYRQRRRLHSVGRDRRIGSRKQRRVLLIELHV